MSSNYYRRGRNPTTAFGVLFIIIGTVALVRQLIVWTEDFVLEFLFNSELTSEEFDEILWHVKELKNTCEKFSHK